MEDKKFSSYLLYAIGEVALVVIGIMLALQLDNWNEERKIHESINRHLITLKQNIIEDQEQLQNLHQVMARNLAQNDSLTKQMKTIIPVDEHTIHHLSRLVLEYRFRPNRNAIETIYQSNELPYLQQNLQHAILDYYALVRKTQEREEISNNHIQGKYEPYIEEIYPEVFQKSNGWDFIKTAYADDPRIRKPLNPKKFLNDRVLEAHLFARYYQCKQLTNFYASLLESAQKIITILENTK